MAGQQQIEIIDQESYHEKYLSNLLKQADLYYLEKKFALDTDFDRQKMRHSQLLEKVLSNETCELMDWVYKKINGKLIIEKSKPIRDLNIIAIELPEVKMCDIFDDTCDWKNIEW